MDNETRQYGRPGDEPQRPRPRQYFPDQSEQQAQYDDQYYQPQYQQYEPQYEPQYQEPYQPEPQKGSSAASIALGVFAALAFIAAVVLFFLWQGAAADAKKQPLTETVTQTTTATETTTTTTTKFPSIFRDREEATSMLPPEPLPDDVEIPRDVRDSARDILDQIRDGADQFLQAQ